MHYRAAVASDSSPVEDGRGAVNGDHHQEISVGMHLSRGPPAFPPSMHRNLSTRQCICSSVLALPYLGLYASAFV